MFNLIRTLSAATLAIAVVSAPAFADEQSRAGAATYAPTVIGAMYETKGLARSVADVRLQGGFLTAGAVRWTVEAPSAGARIPVVTVVGALAESRSLARSATDARRQGGFATAGAVRWIDAPAGNLEAKAPATVGSL